MSKEKIVQLLHTNGTTQKDFAVDDKNQTNRRARRRVKQLIELVNWTTDAST